MLGGEPARPAEGFRDAFVRAFGALADLYTNFRSDGLLAASVWEGKLAEYLHVKVDGDPEFAIVGRHDVCDLSLGRDAAVSLRHALLGVRAVHGEARVRLVDLSSGLGFQGEDGRRCEALAADGPLFVRVGKYHVFLLPTGSLAPWSWAPTAEETWATFPERIYRDCRLPARAPDPLRNAGGKARPGTVITRIAEPPSPLRPFRPSAGARGAKVAILELATADRREQFAVHEADVERGLLVGRYERCPLGAHDKTMSRVHLVVLRDGEDVWAVDAASTNGTSEAGQPVRRARLSDGTTLLLTRGLWLSWHVSRS